MKDHFDDEELKPLPETSNDADDGQGDESSYEMDDEPFQGFPDQPDEEAFDEPVGEPRKNPWIWIGNCLPGTAFALVFAALLASQPVVFLVLFLVFAPALSYLFYRIDSASRKDQLNEDKAPDPASRPIHPE